MLRKSSSNLGPPGSSMTPSPEDRGHTTALSACPAGGSLHGPWPTHLSCLLSPSALWGLAVGLDVCLDAGILVPGAHIQSHIPEPWKMSTDPSPPAFPAHRSPGSSPNNPVYTTTACRGGTH